MKWVKMIFNRRRNQKGSDACNFRKNTLTTVCPKRFLDPVFLKHSLTTVCGKIKKIVSDKKYRLHGLRAKLSDWSTLIPPAGASCKGASLIEFAVCMPILIILLFYINDLIRIKRYYSQTEFVGQQMANIIQNISQNRSDKRIKQNDIKYAITLANQTIYPGITIFKQGSGHPLIHASYTRIYYITQGDNANTVSCRWNSCAYSTNRVPPPTNICYANKDWFQPDSSVGNGKNVSPSQIYPSLRLDSNPKLIIETSLVFDHFTYNYDINGKIVYNKQALGLHIVNPPRHRAWHFPSVVIFTPKPGLFDPDNPPTT